jgi:hypothetical protein
MYNHNAEALSMYTVKPPNKGPLKSNVAPNSNGTGWNGLLFPYIYFKKPKMDNKQVAPNGRCCSAVSLYVYIWFRLVMLLNLSFVERPNTGHG